MRSVRDTAAPAPDQNPRRELRARVLQVEESRGEGGEGFDFLERDAQRDEAEPHARPGEEGAFGCEEVCVGRGRLVGVGG